MAYTLSTKGLNMIKGFEKFVSKPYLDGGGVPTIGYGTTFYSNGKNVKMTDSAITEVQASNELQYYINNHIFPDLTYVTTQLTQNQVDSLASFIYNIGDAGFKKSTLLKKINSNSPCSEIKFEFSRWNKDNGQVIKGLTIRRRVEADNYCQ